MSTGPGPLERFLTLLALLLASWVILLGILWLLLKVLRYLSVVQAGLAHL